MNASVGLGRLKQQARLEQWGRSESVVAEAARKGSSSPKTRRVHFRFGDDRSYGKYFVNDDIVFSHVVATLSGGTASAEDSLIRAVRRVADRITDPVLKKQVAGLIGQESTHAQQHRRLNEKLVEMGYPIRWMYSKSSEKSRIRGEHRLLARVHLASIAFNEHFNAVLARRVLSSHEIQAIPGDPEVWHLLNWHALEELEHKSVVFDLYRAMGGSERLRIAIAIGGLVVFPFSFVLMVMSPLRDPVARRQPLRLVREAHALYRGPLGRGMLSELAKQLRPRFHPVDIDTNELVERWQQELFGSRGVLVDHLK